MLNPEKISHKHLTELSTSPVRCSYFTSGNPKKVIYFILFMLPQNKTNSNCCSAALAVTTVVGGVAQW